MSELENLLFCVDFGGRAFVVSVFVFLGFQPGYRPIRTLVFSTCASFALTSACNSSNCYLRAEGSEIDASPK